MKEEKQQIADIDRSVYDIKDHQVLLLYEDLP